MKKFNLTAIYTGAHGTQGFAAEQPYAFKLSIQKGRILLEGTPHGTPAEYNNIFEFLTEWKSVVIVGEDTEYQPVLTFGQSAVGLTFNHGVGDISAQIDTAKQICADAIDQMNDLRAVSQSGEYKALATIACRSLQASQMAMVKAITWKD